MVYIWYMAIGQPPQTPPTTVGGEGYLPGMGGAQDLALTHPLFGSEPPLRSLCSAQNRPYIFHIRRRTTPTFSVFGAELPLRFLCSAQKRPYVFCARRRTALTFSVFGAEPPYIFCVRRRTILMFSVFVHSHFGSWSCSKPC